MDPTYRRIRKAMPPPEQVHRDKREMVLVFGGRRWSEEERLAYMKRRTW